jgi:hypothetical protein
MYRFGYDAGYSTNYFVACGGFPKFTLGVSPMHLLCKASPRLAHGTRGERTSPTHPLLSPEI